MKARGEEGFLFEGIDWN